MTTLRCLGFDKHWGKKKYIESDKWAKLIKILSNSKKWSSFKFKNQKMVLLVNPLKKNHVFIQKIMFLSKKIEFFTPCRQSTCLLNFFQRLHLLERDMCFFRLSAELLDFWMLWKNSFRSTRDKNKHLKFCYIHVYSVSIIGTIEFPSVHVKPCENEDFRFIFILQCNCYCFSLKNCITLNKNGLMWTLGLWYFLDGKFS